MPKSLIVCCDGTWNKSDQKGNPTNVTKMARAILPSANGRVQQIYYDEGVGTGNLMDRLMGGALGLGLDENVQQAYRFLALNYEPGDAVMMFGFSRGAYTVRSLAGLVSLIGLLRKGDLDKMPKIWSYYRTPKDDRRDDMIDPGWTEGRRPEIEILGVWDTVGSLGIPTNWRLSLSRRSFAFHDVKLGAKIRRAYQALAIDEHRKPFAPAIWDSKAKLPHQVVEQVWFCGAHSNVGGGYDDAKLSDISFLWMCDKIGETLALDRDYLDRKVERVEEGKAWGRQVDSFSRWKLFGRIERKIGFDNSETVSRTAFVRRYIGSQSLSPQPYLPYPYKSGPLETYIDRYKRAGRAIPNMYPDDGA